MIMRWGVCVSCDRANVRILVKDTAAAKNGYGPYVEPVSVDINSAGGRTGPAPGHIVDGAASVCVPPTKSEVIMR